MTADQLDDAPKRFKLKLAVMSLLLTTPVWAAMGFGIYNLKSSFDCLLVPTPTQDLATCEDALTRPLSLGLLRTGLILKTAKAHKAKGAVEVAINLLKTEIESNPTNNMVRLQLAGILRDTLDYQEAANHYLILHKAFPDNQNHFSNVLTTLADANRAEEAVTLAKPSAEKHNNAWSWEWLGWIEQKAGNFEASAISYGKASALEPMMDHLLLWQEYSLELAKKNEAALQAYDKAIALAKTAENIGYRISLNTKLGNIDAARADYELTIDIDPSAFNRTNYARFLLNEIDYKKADQLLDEARAAEPKHYSALDQTVRAKILLGDFSAARAAIEDFKAINPDEYEAAYWQAFLDDEMGHEIEAVKGYKQLLNKWPDWSVLHFDIGHSLIDLNLPQISLQWFDKAIELNPQSADAYSGGSRAYLHLEMPERALGDAEKAVSLHPMLAMAHARRASALAQLDRKVEALQSYEEAMRLRPRLTWLREDFAILLEQLGQNKKAEEVRAQGKPL